MEYFKSAIAILILIAIGVAAYLLYEDKTGSQVCIIGEDCSIVRNSEYSQIFGIKVSTFGLISTIALLLIHYLAFIKKIPYKFFLWTAYIGAAFAIYFLYLQFFVIKAVCSYCVSIDSAILLIFAAANYEYFKLQKN